MRAAGRDMPEGWAERVAALESRYPRVLTQEPWLRVLTQRQLRGPVRLFLVEGRVEGEPW